MKIYNPEKFPNYKTERQWAKRGYLPKHGAEGITLWTNPYYASYYPYFSPDEVEAATPEQLHEYFRPERERQNQLAKIRRKRKKEKRLAEIAREKEEAERRQQKEIKGMIQDAALPYLKRIMELHKIIDSLSNEDPAVTKARKCVVIDTETTGLDLENDELLQVSIIDFSGNILFNSYFKPAVSSWDEAEEINHITPHMVQDAPALSEKIAEINEILCCADQIIGYNVTFDLNMLIGNGLVLLNNPDIIDVMKLFAPIYGDWNEKYQSYNWKKLTLAANKYGFDWNSAPGRPHNSLADCYATLHVYKKICEDERKPQIPPAQFNQILNEYESAIDQPDTDDF